MILIICKNCGDKGYLDLIKKDKDLTKFIKISNNCSSCRKEKNNGKSRNDK